MKLKERESDSFFLYLKKSFFILSKIFFNRKIRKLYIFTFISIFFIAGIFIGLIFSGYFGTFDQPSGRAYSLLVSLGINSPHDLKIFTEGIFKENIKIPFNYIKGQFSNPEKLSINIQFKDYKKIEFKRQQALDLGVLVSSGDDYVPATIIHDGKKYDTELRLKGDSPDHWKGDKWSFRIRIKGNTLLGMSVFSIQDPATRQEVNELVYQRSLQEEGIIGLRYKFIEVMINGENKGIYALEEHFTKELIEYNNQREGIILKFDEDTAFENSVKRDSLSFSFDENFYGSPITTFGSEKKVLNDSIKLSQFKKAMSLLEAFREGSLKPHEVFDADKSAKYYATSTLINCVHGKVWHNARFYYNPITSLLEPVGFDGSCRKDGSGKAMKEYVPVCIHVPDTKYYCTYNEKDFSDLILNDGVIFEKYIEELEKISKKEYLDNLFIKLDKEIRESINIIHKENPFYHFSTDGFYNGQNQIKGLLDPLEGINAYFETNSEKKIILSLGNTNFLPIEILNIYYNGTSFPLIDPKKRILQPRKLSELPEYKKIGFKIPEDFEWKEEYVFDSIVNYKIFGVNKIKNVSIFPWPYAEENLPEEDFIRKGSNINSFEMLEINEDTKLINIKKGFWVLNESLIIPRGFSVVGNEETTIDLINNSMILSYSGMKLSGDEKNPIKIISSDGSGQGLTILNSENNTYLSNVIFSNLTSPSKDGWELSGAINFHETTINLNNVSFYDIHSEDTLNIINSKFEIKNSFFGNCSFDCLDSDFSEGIIEQSSFINCGNDCLDFSGSIVNMSNLKLFDIEDKGLSVGERSNITVKDIEIGGENVNIAVASKDQSKIILNGINISNAKYGFAVYQKKSEYGPASIVALNVNFSMVKENYIVEEKSELRINNIIILNNNKNVYEKLYG